MENGKGKYWLIELSQLNRPLNIRGPYYSRGAAIDDMRPYEKIVEYSILWQQLDKDIQYKRRSNGRPSMLE